MKNLQNSYPRRKRTGYYGILPQYELAKRQMDDFGGMIAFEVAGGYEGVTKFLDRLELCSLAVSLVNMDTLIEHP